MSGTSELHTIGGQARHCHPVECPPGTQAVLCESGRPNTTYCEPCPPNTYSDRQTSSTNGTRCRAARVCAKNAGLTDVPLDPDVPEGIRDRLCRCWWEKGYQDRDYIPGRPPDECVHCQSAEYVKNGLCTLCNTTIIADNAGQRTCSSTPRYTSTVQYNVMTSTPYSDGLASNLTSTEGPGSSGLSAGAIAGIVGGVMIPVIIAVFFLIMWCKKKRILCRKRSKNQTSRRSSIASSTSTIVRMSDITENTPDGVLAAALTNSSTMNGTATSVHEDTESAPLLPGNTSPAEIITTQQTGQQERETEPIVPRVSPAISEPHSVNGDPQYTADLDFRSDPPEALDQGLGHEADELNASNGDPERPDVGQQIHIHQHNMVHVETMNITAGGDVRIDPSNQTNVAQTPDLASEDRPSHSQTSASSTDSGPSTASIEVVERSGGDPRSEQQDEHRLDISIPQSNNT